VPIKSNVAHRPAGALVVGVSSRMRLDQLYTSFLDLVGAQIATAVHRIASAESFFDPNVVKVAIDEEGLAMYFSRAPIPYARDAFARSRTELPPDFPAWRHIGIYAYRVRFLREYSSLTPTAAERFEALEQLRALGHGHRIAVAIWKAPLEPGVDTAQDLERVRRRLGA